MRADPVGRSRGLAATARITYREPAAVTAMLDGFTLVDPGLASLPESTSTSSCPWSGLRADRLVNKQGSQAGG